MNENDMIHTTFIIERGLYCYKFMTFGFKNAKEMYQRLINMVIKVKESKDHIEDAKKVFEIFRKFRMKLNPMKNAFNVSSRKFFGMW